MINLYIDTCSFIKLLKESQGEFLISNLEFWIKKGSVKLFTHEHILNEWTHHKEDQRRRLIELQETRYNQRNSLFTKQI